MAGSHGNSTSLPTRTPNRMAATSSAKQRSIVSFFKKSSSSPCGQPPALGQSASCLKDDKSKTFNSFPELSSPTPSSDHPDLPNSRNSADKSGSNRSPATDDNPRLFSRRVKTPAVYAESSDEDEPFVGAVSTQSSRRGGRSRPVIKDEEDYDGGSGETEQDDNDDDVGDFVSGDSGSDSPPSRKRKRRSKSTISRKRTTLSPSEIERASPEPGQEFPTDDVAGASSASHWRYEPDSTDKHPVRRPVERVKEKSSQREKAHTREPEERYPWLANIRDKEKRSPSDPDYDLRTVYIPPFAWTKFSPFERQYWEIKQNLWDTIVFFKKGKFYELYENDATVGHQEFDLKMTDRVNMRMVGVPESSLDYWVNQFIAKQYKVARVDQMETNLGKEMRERLDKSGKKIDKIISRQLACVLTGGTLVDSSMLQDDMAAYCAAVKESVLDGCPAFGIAFADTATGRFFFSSFVDDAEYTKFETFVAQIGPRELLLERSCLSTKARRILKNNTGPTTIWTHLKTGTEFWDAEMTRKELDCGSYFGNNSDTQKYQAWPKAILEHMNDDLVLSALGALLFYLKFLKLERPLLSQRNFDTYDPIQPCGTLVLDGQTLVNLELFINSTNGGPEGTLFNLLNKCVTPFGKRLFRQWVAHPLCNIGRINERLDAIEALNENSSIREQFISQLLKMPDLERLISRIHAQSCKAEDFVRTLEGFEQIGYAVSLLSPLRGGSRLVDKLISSMPDLDAALSYWKSAFDRKRARKDKLLIPERGIDDEFDMSLERMADIRGQLDALLVSKKLELRCKSLRYADVGKEIFQMEAPKSVKVPDKWRQTSATKDVKRWYFPQLTQLVRELQEAEELHSQLVKETARRFFQRFDLEFDRWLKAIRVISQLDCLISLAKSSISLGEPCCRPHFVDEQRSLVQFEELRHPCMLNTVDDFIPNDVSLGGGDAKMGLLTGANAAGKSTVLRMTCVAVIMAQMGCFVPAAAARLTPVDRIMSRLGANDNIFAAQSTFFVELSETKKILTRATDRSLVILDELGRGTSSYDGVAVAQAVLHHVASHVGCLGFFATHYHSLAAEFENHPEIRPKRMKIHVDDTERRVTFLYKLEDGVAEGSFGMHCAAMCGVPSRVIERAEVAAREWEHTSRLKDSLEKAKAGCYIPLGFISDLASLLGDKGEVGAMGLDVLLKVIDKL